MPYREWHCLPLNNVQLYLYDTVRPHDSQRWVTGRHNDIVARHIVSNSPVYRSPQTRVLSSPSRPAGSVPDASITLRVCDDHDRRCCNVPIVDEVAMLVPGEDPGEDLGQDCGRSMSVAILANQ